MTDHTPTPWVVKSFPTKYPDLRTYNVNAPFGWREANGKYRCCGVASGLDSAADAALIVRAVNAHADLVAALRRMVDWNDNDQGSGKLEDAINAARAALAKATA